MALGCCGYGLVFGRCARESKVVVKCMSVGPASDVGVVVVDVVLSGTGRMDGTCLVGHVRISVRMVHRLVSLGSGSVIMFLAVPCSLCRRVVVNLLIIPAFCFCLVIFAWVVVDHGSAIVVTNICRIVFGRKT